jgi:hypothetical protein
MTKDFVVIARSSDRPTADKLVISRADYEAGKRDCPAWIVRSSGEQGSEAPLQTFFKFGTWQITRAGQRVGRGS